MDPDPSVVAFEVYCRRRQIAEDLDETIEAFEAFQRQRDVRTPPRRLEALRQCFKPATSTLVSPALAKAERQYLREMYLDAAIAHQRALKAKNHYERVRPTAAGSP